MNRTVMPKSKNIPAELDLKITFIQSRSLISDGKWDKRHSNNNKTMYVFFIYIRFLKSMSKMIFFDMP